MDHRDCRTQSYTPVWIKTRIFSPAMEPECPSGIISGIFDPVWASDYPFGIVFGIFDPVDMVESHSRGWLVRVRKKIWGPAPQITIVRSTVAPDPFTKSDWHQGAETGAILSVTDSILIGTCSIKLPRQDRNSAWDPVAGWKVAERRKNSLRQDHKDAQSPFAREKVAEMQNKSCDRTGEALRVLSQKEKRQKCEKSPRDRTVEGLRILSRKKQRCRIQSKD